MTAQELGGENGSYASIGMRLPELESLDPRVFPFEQTPNRGLSLEGPVSPFLTWKPLSLQRKVELDSTGRFIVVRENLNGRPLRMPYMVSIEDYLNHRLSYEQRLAWHQAAAANIYKAGDDQRRGPGGVNIDIPVAIKSKAFEQIFGGNTVGLNVQGDITIKGGFRTEDRSEVKTAFTRGSDFSFKMNQTQRFTVTGRIGDKVTVNVDQDSERAFDFENNIRLNYTGYDDDIVKKIEAGNISLTLPGTRFAGGTSAGLFGLKSEMQLGNLAITTVASQEKGENKRLTISGGAASEAPRTIHDYDYKRSTRFFLDHSYREQYRYYREPWNNQLNPNVPGNPQPINRIEVYKSAPGYDANPKAIKGKAYPDPDSTGKNANEVYPGHFIRLEPNTDYYVNKDLGWIAMNSRLNYDEVLAVAYEDNTGRIVGNVDYNVTDTTQQNIVLKLIKQKGGDPIPSQSTYDLEWKNVYDLGGREIPDEGFELKIFFKPTAGDPQEILVGTGGSQRSYLNVFGLDVRDNTGAYKPDNIVDNDPFIVDLRRGELIFPDLRPFDPVGIIEATTGFQTSDLPADKRVKSIYTSTSQTDHQKDSKFYIEVKSQKRSSNYSLGFNIIENSEEVFLNGRKLARDVDYVIDYFSGSLTITNEEASKPNANVEVSYQSNQLFQLEKKTILGTRAEYRFNQNNFIGGTFLYLNERTLDQRVRLGSVDKGPMQNLVWDINTALQFEPNFLSRALDAMPFISTQEPSNLRLEAEIAQVLPNPNTIKPLVSGDADGVAYVDDFEASKRTTPLGVIRRGWVQSSIPRTVLDDPINPQTQDVPGFRKERSALARRGTLIWYNPFYGVLTADIFRREVLAQDRTTQVLTLVFTPTDSLPTKVNLQTTKSWGGIMRALSSGFFNQTESKFLEIWFLGTKGRMHIELGQISEDIIPNGTLHSEDKIPRNKVLDDQEDVGLDGIALPDPQDFWDLNKDGIRNWGEPLSNDDWSYSSQDNNYTYINGTENNKNDANEGGGAIRPDTEDINDNGDIDPADNYFSYSFSLDPTHPDRQEFQQGQGNGDPRWRLYRIPLNDSTLFTSGNRRDVGKPDFTRIEYVRIWVDSFEVAKPETISIAEISLAGNEWKEAGIGGSDTDLTGFNRADPRFEVSIVNTEENPAYRKPPGVEQEEDRITGLATKEQSQVLRVNEPGLGYNEIAAAQKTFLQPLNLINYNRLKMFVYGRDDAGTHITDNNSAIEFFIRFGADDKNYYEFRELVFPGWDSLAKRNDMDIDLVNELTVLKLDSTKYDTAKGYFVKRLERQPTQELRIKGNPSLTIVRTLIAGIKNLSPTPFTGEIWMDELRVTNVKKDKGMAMRISANLKLADFLSVNAEVNRQDADFHSISDRFGRGDTRESLTLAGSMTLDKILPQSWGLSVPVSMNYTSSTGLPKYFPGRDIQVTKSLPDSILKTIRSVNQQFGVNFTIRRRLKSQNFFIKNTLDNVAGNLSYTQNHASSSQIFKSDREAWSGDVSYNLTFSNKNFIKPFAWLPKAPLVGKLTETKLYYTPQNFSAQLQATNSKDSSVTRLTNGRRGLASGTPVYTAGRNYRTSMKLVESLTADFSRSFTSDLLSKLRRYNALRRAERDSLRAIGALRRPQSGLMAFLSGDNEDLSLNQSVGLRYNPNLFSWLNNNFNYTANYNYTNNITQGAVGRSARTSTNFTASATLRLATLFQSLNKPGSSSKREAPGQSRQAPRPSPEERQQPGVQPEEKEGEEVPAEQQGQRQPPDQPSKGKQEKKKESKPSQPRRSISFASLFNKFKDITLSFSRAESYSDNALKPGTPDWRYQLGFTKYPGLSQVEGITPLPASTSRNDNYSAQTGLDISRNLNITLRLDHSESRTQNTTVSGSTSDTWLGSKQNRFFILPEGGIPFPEWTITWSGLERLKLFSGFATSLSLSHGFGGKKTSIWTERSVVIDGKPVIQRVTTSDDFSFNFKPLIKINLTWKNGMISSFQYNKTTGDRPTYTFDPLRGENVEQGASLTRNSDISLTTSYSKRSGFRLPLPFLKNKELKNSVDVSVTFLRSVSQQAQTRIGTIGEIGANETKRWSLRPQMTYSFSNRVRGGAHFEIGKTESKLSGTTNIKELGIDVNISIRGE